VGLADDAYVVASASPTGWSRRPTRYLRMDGETPANPTTPTASRARSWCSTAPGPGTLEGIERQAYDGTELPVAPTWSTAEITTRDIDRGDTRTSS
jgi:glutamine---fructose-6-phosphate transaminase (isomerizing)